MLQVQLPKFHGERYTALLGEIDQASKMKESIQRKRDNNEQLSQRENEFLAPHSVDRPPLGYMTYEESIFMILINHNVRNMEDWAKQIKVVENTLTTAQKQLDEALAKKNSKVTMEGIRDGFSAKAVCAL